MTAGKNGLGRLEFIERKCKSVLGTATMSQIVVSIIEAVDGASGMRWAKSADRGQSPKWLTNSQQVKERFPRTF